MELCSSDRALSRTDMAALLRSLLLLACIACAAGFHAAPLRPAVRSAALSPSSNVQVR